MKVWESNNGINLALYRITRYDQFRAILPLLREKAEIIATSVFKNKVSSEQVLNSMGSKILEKDEKFGLWVAFEDTEIVGYASTIIIPDDDERPSCLVYNLYIKPNRLLSFFKHIGPHIELWAKSLGAKYMYTGSGHNIEAVAKIGSHHGYTKSRMIFEKYIGD